MRVVDGSFTDFRYEKSGFEFRTKQDRASLDRGRIKTAISVLAAQGLVHVEHPPSKKNDFGIANAYRLAFIKSRNHMGTNGRMICPCDA
jgi:hypothetical protein